MPLKVAIIGSGNWGSAIARIIGNNVKEHNKEFDEEVRMWVFEETVNGRKLTEIINTDHENVKYLPGFKFPPNVVAVPDVVETVKDADVIVFVIPHQFIGKTCAQLVGKVKPGAVGVTLIKGVGVAPNGGLKLISEEIKEALKIDVCALMGANLAPEVAAEKFCEATIGSEKADQGAMLKRLFQTQNFLISVVSDAHTVELCGALKNIVACAAGFVDGLQLGDNTKAAVIRLGLNEMRRFIDTFYPGSNLSTYFESCGVADLITSCYGGRNRKVGEAMVKTGKPLKELEKEMLGGQQLQGAPTAAEVYPMLQSKGLENQFPLLVSVHKICIGEQKPIALIDALRKAHHM